MGKKQSVAVLKIDYFLLSSGCKYLLPPSAPAALLCWTVHTSLGTALYYLMHRFLMNFVSDACPVHGVVIGSSLLLFTSCVTVFV